MKKWLSFLLLFVSFSCFASNCPQALSTNDPNFCPSFKDAAICNCMAKGLPYSLCSDVKQLYARLIGIFVTVEKLCAFQKETNKEICINDWGCYMNGGKDKAGLTCSSTGNACL